MSEANRYEMNRRAFLQAVGLLGGASLLAACAAPTGGAQAPGSAATTSSAAASSSTGGQVVNFLWTDTSNLRQPLIQDFEKASGIKVNQTQVQYNQLFDKIVTSVQGGADVDVIEMDTIWTPQFASAGWVQDISDRATDAITSDVPESALSAVRFNGKLYGMPWFNSAKHLFYNQKLLKDAGFDAPPATLDEFVEQAKATTEGGPVGFGLVVEASRKPDLRLGSAHVYAEGCPDPRRRRQGGLQRDGRHRCLAVDGGPALHAQGCGSGFAGVHRGRCA